MSEYLYRTVLYTEEYMPKMLPLSVKTLSIFLQKRFADMGFAVTLKKKYRPSLASCCGCEGPEHYTLTVSVPAEKERIMSYIPVSANPEEEHPGIDLNISHLRQRKIEFFQQEALENQKSKEIRETALRETQKKFAAKVKEQILSFPSDVQKFEIPIPKIGAGLRGATNVSILVANELTATGKWDVSFKETEEYPYPKMEKMILVLTRKS